MIAKLTVVTFHPIPAAHPTATAATPGTTTSSIGMTAMMLNRIPAAIERTNFSSR